MLGNSIHLSGLNAKPLIIAHRQGSVQKCLGFLALQCQNGRRHSGKPKTSLKLFPRKVVCEIPGHNNSTYLILTNGCQDPASIMESSLSVSSLVNSTLRNLKVEFIGLASSDIGSTVLGDPANIVYDHRELMTRCPMLQLTPHPYQDHHSPRTHPLPLPEALSSAPYPISPCQA